MKTDYIQKMLASYPLLESCRLDISSAIDVLTACVENGNKILTCGNGGSAADAEHIVGELLKGFHLKRKLPAAEIAKISRRYPEEAEFIADNLQEGIPAISLVSGVAFFTAFLNDMNPDFVFAQQVYALGKEGDVLIAISTSGNSPNIVNAVKVAAVNGMKTISLTGHAGGALGNLSDITIKAPDSKVATIQELHLPIYHCICSVLEQRLFAS